MTQPSTATNSTPGADSTTASEPNQASIADNDQHLDIKSGEDQPLSTPQRWAYGLGIVLAVYLLMAAIDSLSAGFQLVLGPQAEGFFSLAYNPFLGLLVGILVTALVQSSSAVTAILVAMVAGGLPIAIAIPIVLGANAGTTITNTLVSLGYVGDDEAFERGFAAATLHDFFNLFSLLLFFPLELLFHPLERSSAWLVDTIYPINPLPLDWANFPIGNFLLWPSHRLWAALINALPYPWDGVLFFSFSVGLLTVAVTGLSWLMKRLLTGSATRWVQRLVGQGSALGLATGAGLTALWQSSSMTTSLMVPLASAELVSLEMVYPFVLGANIGTCITAMLAVLALGNMPVAFQLALVHLGFNLAGVTFVYGIPVLRQIPLRAARQLAHWAMEYRLLAILYVLLVFFILPGGLLATTMYFIP